MDAGGERAEVVLTSVQTGKLNDVDPQAWIADHQISDLAALSPWNRRRERMDLAA